MEGGAFSWSTGRGRQPKQAEIGSQWQTCLRSWRLSGRELCLLSQPFGQSAHPLLSMSCFPPGLGAAGRGFRGTGVTQRGLLCFHCCAAPPRAGRHAEIPDALAKMWWWKSRGRAQFPWFVMFCMLEHKPLIEGHSAGRLQLSGRKVWDLQQNLPYGLVWNVKLEELSKLWVKSDEWIQRQTIWPVKSGLVTARKQNV